MINVLYVAQLVEHCTSFREVMGPNLVQAWIFFSGFIHVVFITAKSASKFHWYFYVTYLHAHVITNESQPCSVTCLLHPYVTIGAIIMIIMPLCCFVSIISLQMYQKYDLPLSLDFCCNLPKLLVIFHPIDSEIVSRWWKVNIVHIISLVINWSETRNNISVVLLLGVTWFFFLSLVFAPLKKVLIWERKIGSLLENQLFTEPGACEIRQRTLRRAYKYVCIKILILPAPTRCPL